MRRELAAAVTCTGDDEHDRITYSHDLSTVIEAHHAMVTSTDAGETWPRDFYDPVLADAPADSGAVTCQFFA